MKVGDIVYKIHGDKKGKYEVGRLAIDKVGTKYFYIGKDRFGKEEFENRNMATVDMELCFRVHNYDVLKLSEVKRVIKKKMVELISKELRKDIYNIGATLSKERQKNLIKGYFKECE